MSSILEIRARLRNYRVRLSDMQADVRHHKQLSPDSGKRISDAIVEANNAVKAAIEQINQELTT